MSAVSNSESATPTNHFLHFWYFLHIKTYQQPVEIQFAIICIRIERHISIILKTTFKPKIGLNLVCIPAFFAESKN